MQIFLSWQEKFRLLIVITLLGLGLITATSFWASRQVNAALQARENATAFAGNLAIDGNPKDEFKQLGEACNRMIQGISRILCQVVEANLTLTELHAYLGASVRDLGAQCCSVKGGSGRLPQVRRPEHMPYVYVHIYEVAGWIGARSRRFIHPPNLDGG
jgi:methyl-accepting chemotaxis protein